MAQFTRRNIWGLETRDPSGLWDPYTLAYAKAVAIMRSRPADNPTSWSFQAAMHGTYATPALATWNQCQHGTWYFLPWHRMYCYWFERIVRAIVLEQGGPDDWALPFWNYSAGGVQAALPPAFRSPTWNPGGGGDEPNPLYTTHRAPAYNAGAPLPPEAISLHALASGNFTGNPLPGFGGPQTGFSHEPTQFGLLERVPHNAVHVFVGGDQQDQCAGGWMVDPNCAAEDPIFWLHHSNIDRLWNAWNDGGGTNPTDAAWAGYRFQFWDEHGQPQTMTPGDVTSLAPLDYAYEAQPTQKTATGETVRMTGPKPTEDDPLGDRRGAPRLLAANDQAVALSGERSDVRVSLAAQAAESLRRAADPSDPSVRYVYLNVEGLTAEQTPGMAWQVRLTLPDGAEHDVGLVTFFGFKEQLRDDHDHGLGPMAHTFEVTGLVAGVDDDVTVSFVPIGGEGASEGATGRGSPRVARVTITAH